VSSPLGGIRVVARELYAAGPYETLHRAELGSEVIKIRAVSG